MKPEHTNRGVVEELVDAMSATSFGIKQANDGLLEVGEVDVTFIEPIDIDADRFAATLRAVVDSAQPGLKRLQLSHGSATLRMDERNNLKALHFVRKPPSPS